MAGEWDWLKNFGALGMLPPFSNFMPGQPAPSGATTTYMPSVPPNQPPMGDAPDFSNWAYIHGTNPVGPIGNDNPMGGDKVRRPWPGLEIMPADTKPTYTAPGVPGLLPTVGPPPEQPPRRNVVPASNPPPMFGTPNTLPLINSVPYSETQPQKTEAAPQRPGWWERNDDLVGKEGSLWRAMSQFGQGVSTARPGEHWAQTLNRGLSYANESFSEEPFRKARLGQLQDVADERRAKTERRKAWNAFVKEQPADSPLRRWGPFLSPEKLAEKAFDKPAPGFELGEDGRYRLNLEWAEQRLKEREASSRDTALQRNAEFIARTYGIPLQDALNMARPQGTGANSTDRAALDAYLKANPGKTAWDYQKEKADLRRGSNRPTAMIQNAQYLARTLGIPESEAAKIMSQSREQSDTAFYASIYSRAINSPMVAGDPARAADIAKAAVAARKQFQGESGPTKTSATRRTATGPNGQRIYTEDGGQTWFNMDGSPFR